MKDLKTTIVNIFTSKLNESLCDTLLNTLSSELRTDSDLEDLTSNILIDSGIGFHYTAIKSQLREELHGK